jgi:phenylacetic acid degradation operon negative regulatory protein
MRSRALDQWIEARIAARPLRAKSVIVTVLGDMIVPHGGTFGLAGFIGMVEPLGLNDRLVRTSVFRLSREKWLVSEQIGRRSFYSVTTSGRRRFELAAHRFYGDPRAPWDGDWRLVLLPNDCLPAAERDALRKELLWEGFAAIAPGVLAHPSAENDALLDILENAGAHDKVVVMSAKSLGALSARPLRELVDQCWNLRAIADEYRAFVDDFRPVARILRNASSLDPAQSFLVRTLLMHEFRRAQLRDPLLPRQLEPADWPGDVARALCQDIYRLCWAGTEEHLAATLDTADGPLPPVADGSHARFAGVAAEAQVDAA